MEQILVDHGISFLREGHHHCRPGWIQLDCPFCGTDGSYHLGWCLDSQYFSCWKCGWKPADKTLVALGVSSIQEARKLLDLAKDDREPTVREAKVRLGLVEPKGLLDLSSPLARSHRDYLRSRKLDPAEISRVWKAQAIAISADLAWRIYLPAMRRGKQVSWTTRSIAKNAKQRYLSASPEQEAFSLKKMVFGADFCYHSIIVVEGPFDALAIGPGAGALCGTAFTAAQVAEIARFPRKVICFDSSPSAQSRADELANQLAAFEGSVINVELDAKDPAEASLKDLRCLRKIAQLAD